MDRSERHGRAVDAWAPRLYPGRVRIDLELVRGRLGSRPSTDLDGPDIRRRAAVAAVLRGGASGAEILLIRRAERAGDPWSGQMALPGGRHDEGDIDLAATAAREALEEVGLDLRRAASPLGRLDDVRTHTRDMIVRPFVWEIRAPVVLVPNAEVAEVVWVDLGSLASGARDTQHVWEEGPPDLRFPGYRVGERVVWGLTHRILGTLLGALR